MKKEVRHWSWFWNILLHMAGLRRQNNSLTLLLLTFTLFFYCAGMFLKENTHISLAGSIFISRRCVHTLLRNTTIRACLFLLPACIACLVQLSLSLRAFLLVGSNNVSFGRCVLLQVSLQAFCWCFFFFCILNGTNLDMRIRFCCCLNFLAEARSSVDSLDYRVAKLQYKVNEAIRMACLFILEEWYIYRLVWIWTSHVMTPSLLINLQEKVSLLACCDFWILLTLFKSDSLQWRLVLFECLEH
jgi:hypothetical protein